MKDDGAIKVALVGKKRRAWRGEDGLVKALPAPLHLARFLND